MAVSFNDKHQIVFINEDKSYNVNEDYTSKKVELNRVLYKMERFFRKNHLLNKGEMLSIEHRPQKHIRSPFVDCIALKMRWIYRDEYLHIVNY
jgi:hypothetical protein